jgi:hypothetical protein
MSDTVLQTAVSTLIPTFAILVGILINNSRLTDVNARLNDLRMDMNSRFDDLKDTWRAELHRVEEVLDARLKHLEER